MKGVVSGKLNLKVLHQRVALYSESRIDLP